MSRYIHPITHLPPVIPIGVQTENGVCDVAFDVAPWLGRWPDLTITVIVQRPGETESYPGVSDVEDGVLLWHVSAADTAIPGTGKVEILGVNADGLRKLSAVTATEIKASIADAPGEAPEAIKPWMDDVLAKVGKTQQDVADLEESKLNTQQGAENAGAHLIVGEDGNIAPQQPGALTITKGDESTTYDGSEAVEVEIPTELPNPNALTITKGKKSTVYDGSEATSMDVPDVLIVQVKTSSGSYVANPTYAEIKAAIEAGTTCLLLHKGAVYAYWGEADDGLDFHVAPEYIDGTTVMRSGLYHQNAIVKADSTVSIRGSYAPTANPYKLTIKGAAAGEYDGSKAVEVEIPVQQPLTIKGAVQAEYDGSAPVEVQIPDKMPNPSALTIKQGDAETAYTGDEAVALEIPAPMNMLIVPARNLDATAQETIRAAVADGKACMMNVDGELWPYIGEHPITDKNDADYGTNLPTFASTLRYRSEAGENDAVIYHRRVRANGNVVSYSAFIKTAVPKALTIKQGGEEIDYNGNESATIDIPDVPVQSVNGKTGAVTIDVPVQSVNGKTGAVTIDVPVQSVNGKTGAVAIDIPEKLPNPSALTLTGAAAGTYDGSEPVSINVPEDNVLIVTCGTGNVSSHSITQITEACNAGKAVFARFKYGPCAPMIGYSSDGRPTFHYTEIVDGGIRISTLRLNEDGTFEHTMPNVSRTPNPSALTVKVGDKTTAYDGSAAVTIDIPEAVTDDHINELIDTKLGVIENGTY